MAVGGFYGDEGKGKIVGYLSIKDKAYIVVIAGSGPQAGHEVTEGKKVTQIPSGFVNPNSRLLIASGTLISPEKVLEEIETYNVKNRIGIDYGCTVIETKHIEKEKKDLVKRIGSVGKGTGPARSDRIYRKAKIAKDVELLKPYLTDVSEEINNALDLDKKVLVEGTQGYALSLMNHEFYPYVTSQNTISSQFASDAFIGPKVIDEIIVTYKSYVSRVGKGPLKNEWSEEEKQKHGIREKATVSQRERRLADFDYEMAKKALIKNTGTQAALTCIDRLFPGNSGIKDFNNLTKDAKSFINEVNQSLKGPKYFKGITLISTSPNLEDTIDLRKV